MELRFGFQHRLSITLSSSFQQSDCFKSLEVHCMAVRAIGGILSDLESLENLDAYVRPETVLSAKSGRNRISSWLMNGISIFFKNLIDDDEFDGNRNFQINWCSARGEIDAGRTYASSFPYWGYVPTSSVYCLTLILIQTIRFDRLLI